MSYQIIDDGILDLTGSDFGGKNGGEDTNWGVGSPPGTYINEHTPMYNTSNHTIKSHMPLDMRGSHDQIYDVYKSNYTSPVDNYDMNNYINRSRQATKSNSRPDMTELMPQRKVSQVYTTPSHPTVDCLSVVNHVESCPICDSYFNKDKKFYLFVMAVLVLIIFYLLRNNKH